MSYFLVEHLLWGNILAQFKTIEQISNQHLWLWSNRPGELIKRLTFAPALLFLKTYNVLFILFLFSFLIKNNEYRFWQFYALFSVLFYWFGTTTLKGYEPMPLAGRMTLTAFPGLCIAGAVFISEISCKYKRYHYLIIFTLLLPLIYFIGFYHPSKDLSAEAMKIVKEEIDRQPEAKILLLCSENRSPKSLEFYFGYNFPRNLDIYPLYAVDTLNLKNYYKAFYYSNSLFVEFLPDAYHEKADTNIASRFSVNSLINGNGIVFDEVVLEKGKL